MYTPCLNCPFFVFKARDHFWRDRIITLPSTHTEELVLHADASDKHSALRAVRVEELCVFPAPISSAHRSACLPYGSKLYTAVLTTRVLLEPVLEGPAGLGGAGSSMTLASDDSIPAYTL